MKVINKLSLRYLKTNKRKAIVIILNIVLATMLLFAVSLGASTIRGHSVNSEINDYGSHHILFKELDSGLYENLINDKKIKSVISIQNVNKITSNQIDESITTNFTLNIFAFNKNIGEYVTLESGDYPQNNKEIIISEDISNKLDYQINDVINNYRVVGIYNNVKQSLGMDGYSVITKDTLKNNLTVNYLVTFKSSILMYKDFYKKADELGLKYTLDHTNDRVYDNIDFNTSLLQSLGQYPNIKTQIGIYSMLFVILLVISMFCMMTIKNAFEISLSERKKYFGALRSIGASKKQIFKMVLFETLLLSLISIPIGLFLGYNFTNLVVYIVNDMVKEINVIDYKIIVYPIYVIIAFIFIVITIIWSSIKPAKNASEISPMEIIRENKTYSVIKSKEKYPFIRKTFGIEGELAYKTIKRNNSKFSVTVNSLIVSIIMFITLSAFVNFLYNNNTSSYGSKEYDIVIQSDNLHKQYEVLEKINNIEEIDDIYIRKFVHLNFKKDNTTLTNIAKNISIDKMYPDIKILGIDNIEYNNLKKRIGLKENKTILYNYGIYFDNGKEKETKWFNENIERIELCSVNENNQNSIITEKGCYYTYDDFYVLNKRDFDTDFWNPTIILPMKEFDVFVENYVKNYGDTFDYQNAKHTIININSDKYVKVDEELNKIFDEYEYLNLDDGYYNYSLIKHEEYIRVSTSAFVINSAMIFIVMISLMSIINTMNTNLSLRETEFSVLRSVGLSKKGLNKMLFLESIFLGVKTIIYGLPSSTFFVALLMYFSYLMSTEGFEFPTNAYIISFFAVFVVVLIMNIYSSNKIKNKNIIDSIRKQSI